MARALYIHWPFCLKKCPYCDFNSHVRDGVDISAWQRALLSDMQHEASLDDSQPLQSIFFGGGTPSLMPPALVAALLRHAEQLWGFADNIEITLEANPSSVEASKFVDLSVAGVNRVSLGLQSLDDERLAFLGRLHSVAESLDALEIAQNTFDRVSFDLIYALPNQTQDRWSKELERALSFGTGHLSLYQLTIEPNTRFATDVRRSAFEPMDDDPAADLYDVTREITGAAGLPAYEISNYARRGQQSRHNLTYWRYNEYCGIGPGAHGRRGGKATLRHKKPENFLHAASQTGHGIKEETSLTPSEQASEAMLMGLRLTEGINLQEMSARFDQRLDALINPEKLEHLTNLGFVWNGEARIGVTPRGMPLLDAILGEIVGDELVTA